MTIRTKVIGGVLAVLCLSLSIAIYTYARAHATNQRLALVSRLFIPLSREVAQLQSHTQSLVDNLRRFYFQTDGSPQSSAQSRVARDLYPYMILRRFEVIDALMERNAEGASPDFIDHVRRRNEQIRTAFEALMGLREESQFPRAYGAVFRGLTALMQRVESESRQVTSDAQFDGKTVLFTSLLVALIALSGGVAAVIFSDRALRSLVQLAESMKTIADGDFSRGLKVRTDDQDEVSKLARQFNRMLSALTDRDCRIQQQQKDLLQHERLAAVGQLSAEIVHEIRNPLNAISLNIDWLQNEILQSVSQQEDEVAKTLASISREVERLHQITEQYLIRARVERDVSASTELNSLIREILEFSREEDKCHRIQVECSLSDGEILVSSERSRMKQALLNVLKNAKEAMPQGGTLRVTTEIESNVSRLRIEDSGYGMNQSTLRRTFQPFFTTKTNGTGLGLLLTKEIIEEARGSIDCKSEIGKGTAFTLKFPV